ncbi:MAG TPA: dihydrodipicolinate synthase family protein [Candidatus Acidoferrales bacterium]|nr:dihydrodipicolinate synthase family protein [Candidatus Acidoferrales bacterium]
MAVKKFSGVFAALLAPRKADDSVDVPALTRLVRFLLSKGVDSFALNGATGELCLARPQHLRAMVKTVREASNGKAKMLCGIGGPSISTVSELAKIAEAEGSSGLLLPMPYYYRYQQHDLDAFCRAVAKQTPLPILLYNLPQFSTGLEPETVRKLIADIPNVIGIKDSGGSLDILRDLTQHGSDACRIVGNDPTLRRALSEDVCDGIVSGIACVLPELVLPLYAQGAGAASAEFDNSWRCLRELANQLETLPTPWGLKWIAQARGIFEAKFAQAQSDARISQGAELQCWFSKWFQTAVPGCTMAA